MRARNRTTTVAFAPRPGRAEALRYNCIKGSGKGVRGHRNTGGAKAPPYNCMTGRAEALPYNCITPAPRPGRAEALPYDRVSGVGQTFRSAFMILIAAMVLSSGCEREARRYQELPAAANRETGVRVTQLEPGSPQQHAEVKSPYQENAWGLGEGKRLYGAYNCAPCHGVNGGGAIGPALMDDKWIYGAQPDQIYATISQGRPDGMPSFGGHVTTQQIWQLVAYVQSMSGQTPPAAAPNRNDDLNGAPAEARRSPQAPVQTGHR